VFVPPGTAHAFGNSGSTPGRMLLITAPPGHEKYFDELRDLVAKGGKPDPEALAKLRAKYDTVQACHADPKLNRKRISRDRIDVPEWASGSNFRSEGVSLMSAVKRVLIVAPECRA
jgi:hypothetical protein